MNFVFKIGFYPLDVKYFQILKSKTESLIVSSILDSRYSNCVCICIFTYVYLTYINMFIYQCHIYIYRNLHP